MFTLCKSSIPCWILFADNRWANINTTEEAHTLTLKALLAESPAKRNRGREGISRGNTNKLNISHAKMILINSWVIVPLPLNGGQSIIHSLWLDATWHAIQLADPPSHVLSGNVRKYSRKVRHNMKDGMWFINNGKYCQNVSCPPSLLVHNSIQQPQLVSSQ